MNRLASRVGLLPALQHANLRESPSYIGKPMLFSALAPFMLTSMLSAMASDCRNLRASIIGLPGELQAVGFEKGNFELRGCCKLCLPCEQLSTPKGSFCSAALLHQELVMLDLCSID